MRKKAIQKEHFCFVSDCIAALLYRVDFVIKFIVIVAGKVRKIKSFFYAPV